MPPFRHLTSARRLLIGGAPGLLSIPGWCIKLARALLFLGLTAAMDAPPDGSIARGPERFFESLPPRKKLLFTTAIESSPAQSWRADRYGAGERKSKPQFSTDRAR